MGEGEGENEGEGEGSPGAAGGGGSGGSGGGPDGGGGRAEATVSLGVVDTAALGAALGELERVHLRGEAPAPAPGTLGGAPAAAASEGGPSKGGGGWLRGMWASPLPKGRGPAIEPFHVHEPGAASHAKTKGAPAAGAGAGAGAGTGKPHPPAWSLPSPGAGVAPHPVPASSGAGAGSQPGTPPRTLTVFAELERLVGGESQPKPGTMLWMERNVASADAPGRPRDEARRDCTVRVVAEPLPEHTCGVCAHVHAHQRWVFCAVCGAKNVEALGGLVWIGRGKGRNRGGEVEAELAPEGPPGTATAPAPS